MFYSTARDENSDSRFLPFQIASERDLEAEFARMVKVFEVSLLRLSFGSERGI